MTLGVAAQLAAAHCPNERTLDPAVCSYNRTQPATLWPSPAMFSGSSSSQSYFSSGINFSFSFYIIL